MKSLDFPHCDLFTSYILIYSVYKYLYANWLTNIF